MDYMQLRPLSGLLLTVGLIVGCTACADAPIRQKYAATKAVATARESGAATLAPQYMDAAQDSLDAGIRELNSQFNRMRWNRSYARSEALFASAIRRAEMAQDRSRRLLGDSEARSGGNYGSAW